MNWAGAALFAAGVATGWAWRRAGETRDLRRYGRMLSFISHELNTPLTAVNMTVLNFLSGVFGVMPKEQQDWMLMMKEQVQRLNALVGELRDFIHLEFHRDLRLRPETVDLRKALDTAIAQNEGTVNRSGARLELDVPADLPQVFADPDRLQRVLGSVLAHARKFRKDGVIKIVARADGADAELRVAFASQGFGAGEPERMLELYYPVSGGFPSQLLASVGTGLGFCREILERQGGSLMLTVDGGGAAELRLRIPQAAAQ